MEKDHGWFQELVVKDEQLCNQLHGSYIFQENITILLKTCNISILLLIHDKLIRKASRIINILRQ